MTYPRTGSRYISEDVFEEVPVLLRKIGKTLSNPLNRHSVDNTKITDHHAIIPTGETPSGISADETTIYQMVVNRFIEAFSPDSEEERMQVRFTHGTNIFTWKACRQISLGWKAVQKGKEAEAEKKEGGEEQVLSSLPNLIEEKTCLYLMQKSPSIRPSQNHSIRKLLYFQQWRMLGKRSRIQKAKKLWQNAA